MIKNTLTIITLIAAMILMLKLGFWQIERLEWKESILAQIDAQEAVIAEETPLNLNNVAEYQRGYINGHYLKKYAILIEPKTNDKGDIGYHLIYPFKTSDGHILLVNWGWHRGETFPVPSYQKFTKLVGYLQHPPEKNRFSPANNPNQNRWYRIDIQQVEKFYDLKNIHQMVFHRLNTGDSELSIPRPRNNHMQYAIFWFTMAGLLIALSVFYTFKMRQP